MSRINKNAVGAEILRAKKRDTTGYAVKLIWLKHKIIIKLILLKSYKGIMGVPNLIYSSSSTKAFKSTVKYYHHKF